MRLRLRLSGRKSVAHDNVDIHDLLRRLRDSSTILAGVNKKNRAEVVAHGALDRRRERHRLPHVRGGKATDREIPDRLRKKEAPQKRGF
jgi:hypothetical protein